MTDPMEAIEAFWQAFLNKMGEDPETTELDYAAWHFCDNLEDANHLAELVKMGVKTATTGALWSYEADQEPLPEVGDLSIVTDWDGRPQCLIETTQVQILPFNQVDAAIAAQEGEGDKSLDHWRKTHWAFFTRELAEFDQEPSQDMPVVCERFKVLFLGED